MQGGKIASKGKDPGEGTDKLIQKKTELVPPDGGWGWVIVFAFALNNVIAVPILQSFGLLFRGRLEQLGISGTHSSVIININSSFGMILGLFSGYLLRTFGYRKIAISGALINSFGVIVTSFADSFEFFVISYGIVSSIGFNLLSTSFNLAINSFFKERRGKAVGFGTTAMGLGPVLMPLVISVLMSIYGVQGTALLLGGFSLHSLVAALLLQPVKWHMKPKKLTGDELEDGNEDDNLDETEKTKSCHGVHECSTKRQRTITAASSIDHDIDTQSIYGFDTPLPERRAVNTRRIRRISGSSFKHSTSHIDDTTPRHRPGDGKFWASAASIETVNLGSSLKIFDDRSYQPLQEVDVSNNDQTKDKKSNEKPEEESKTVLILKVPDANGVGGKDMNGDAYDKDNVDNEKKVDKTKDEEKTFWQRLGDNIISFFDLKLLTDPIYVNLMVGMSLAICAEFNFSLLTPFILNDRGFDTNKIAVIMSVIGGLDIVFRFIVPFFSDHYKIEARNMYIIALCMLVTSRTALIFSESFESVIAVAVALGVAKGVRTVYMTIVIPCYVPIERLAAASGIQMVTNGILLMVFGPLMGVIRDVSGSYDLCIGFINLLTVTTLTMWTVEIIVLSYRRRRQQAKL